MNGAPWGYIHQKKETERVQSQKSELEREHKLLKTIVKKLLENKPLSDAETEFLKEKI